MTAQARAHVAGKIAAGLLMAGCCLSGCRSSSHSLASAADSKSTGSEQDPTPPTLEEIFGEPSIAGIAPRFVSLSADGQWLLFAWDPAAPGSGKPESTTLRLLNVLDPLRSRAASEGQGLDLKSVLPPSPTGDSEEASRTVWSHSGHRLAIARDRDLYLYDPSGPRVELIFRDVAAKKAPQETPKEDSEAASGTDAEASAENGIDETEALPHLASEIRSIAFSKDDSELRFMDADDLFAIPLAADGFSAQVHTFETVLNVSENLDAAAHLLQWSDDLDTVYGRANRPIAAHDTQAEPEEKVANGEPKEAEITPQIWIQSRERGVVLEGMDDLRTIRSDLLSPDGRWLVAREIDESNEPEANLIPRWLGDRVTTSTTRARRADDLAAPTALWVWKATSGTRKALEPLGGERFKKPVTDNASDDDAADKTDSIDESPHPWIRAVGWAPQPKAGSPARFATLILSQDYRDEEIWVFTEGHSERVWSEHDPRWLGGPSYRIAWTPDGEALILGSEASDLLSTPGHNQLFRIDVDSKETRQLTAVEGEVGDFRVLDSGQIVFVASRQDPGQRSIGVLDRIEDSGLFDLRWLPTPEGWNVSPHAGRDAALIVFQHETLLSPPELWASDGTKSWALTDTIPATFRDRKWIRPVTVSATAPDGARVFAHVYLPPGASLEDPELKPRPSIVFVHGAGYLQNVTDSMTNYPLNAMFHSRLAQLGVPVIDVDYRGSAGYGQSFRTDVQYHLGGKDLDDIHGIVDLLAQRGLVDPDRVALYGGSYGGFLTLMALFTAPERWAGGAALRSVTDWRTYNPNYTQPRLGRPSTHPEAYARSSPIDLVDGLEDPLYLFHGLVDRNVFAQDTIRLMEELIDRGLDFDAMLYPSQGHAFSDGAAWLDEYRRIERHLFHCLGLQERN